MLKDKVMVMGKCRKFGVKVNGKIKMSKYNFHILLGKCPLKYFGWKTIDWETVMESLSTPITITAQHCKQT